MANFISKNTGRGAAIRNAAAAATAAELARQVITRAAVSQAVSPNPVYTAPRAPIASAPATSLIQQSGRPTAPTRAPAPPPNIIVENLRQRSATPAPVPAAYKFIPGMGGGGYENIENVRSSPGYQPTVMPPRPSVTPQGPSRSNLLQQQFMDYEAMRLQGGLPPTEIGGYEDYRIPSGTRVVTGSRAQPPSGPVPQASKFMPDRSPGYENIENTRAASRGSLSTLTPLQEERRRTEQGQQERFGRITEGFGQDQRRNAETDTQDEMRRWGEEREANRLFGIQQEIRSIENQLDSSNQYGSQIPVDERVLMEQRLQELRNVEQGIYSANSGIRQPVWSEAWTNLSNLGPEDWGPFKDDVTGSGIWQGARDTIFDNAVGNRILRTAAELQDVVANTAGDIASGPVGQRFGQVMQWYLEEIHQPVKRETADLIYNYALNDPEQSELELTNFGTGFSFIFAIPALVMIEADDILGDGSVRQDIIESYESGGSDAVWETVIGLANGMPWVVKYLWIGTGETLTDPSLWAGPVGRGGQATRGIGAAMRAIPEATLGERIAGTALSRGGQVLQHAGSFVDTVGIEHLIQAGRWGRRKTPGMGLFDESIATRQVENTRTAEAAFESGDRATAAARVEARREGLNRTDDGGFQPTDPGTPPPGPTGPAMTPDQYPDGAAALEADLMTRNNYLVREQLRRANAEDTGAPYTPRPLTPEQQAASQRLQEYQASGGQVEPPPRMAQPAGSVAAAFPEGAATPSQSELPSTQAPTTPRPLDDAPPGNAADDAARLVDQETGEVFFSSKDVPSELPALARAIDESARQIQAPRRTAGRTLTSPIMSGTFPQDVMVEAGVRALRTGDTTTARRVNDYLEFHETSMREAGLGETPFFLDVHEVSARGTRGIAFSVPNKPTTVKGYGRQLTPNELVAVGGEAKAYQVQGALYRGAYEHVYNRVQSEIIGKHAATRAVPGVQLPTSANPALRRNANGDFVGEDFRWLADEYVLTPDQRRADAIMAVLEDDTIPDYIFRAPDGRPYLNRLPAGVRPRSGKQPFMRDEIYGLLRKAREAHQEALNTRPKPDQSARVGGGLGADSQKAGEAIAKAEATEAAMEAKAVVKNAKDTNRYLDDTMKVADEAGMSADEVADIAEFLGLGRNLNALTYQDLWNVRRAVNEFAQQATGTPAAATGTVRKHATRSGYEAVDGDGNVIGYNPTKGAAQTRLDKWIEKHGGTTGIINDPMAGPRRFRERLNQGRLAVQRSADDTGVHATLRNEDLKWANRIGELDNATATYLDQTIDWVPPKKPDPGLEGHEWSVFEAMNWVKFQKSIDPDFKYADEFQRIADLAAHYDPKAQSGLARGLDRLSRTRMVRLYDNTMNVLFRQHRRYGPLTFMRNIVGDWMGTNWQLAIMAEADPVWALRPWNLWNDSRAYVNKYGRDPHRWAETVDNQFIAGTGQLVPRKLMPGVSRGETVLGGKPDANQWAERFFGPLFGKVANVWTVPMGKDLLNQIDLTSRKSLWDSQFENVIRKEAIPAFRKRIIETAGDEVTARRWMQMIEREAQSKMGDAPWPGSFSPADVRDALRGQTNKHHDLSRAWQSELKRSSDNALKRTEDVLFSYRNTNADEIARRIFVFHYWQSRAIPLHARAALRNPILMLSYWRLWKGLEQQAEEDRLPGYIDNGISTMFQFYQSPTGLSAHGSPIGIIAPTTLFDIHDEKGQRLQVLTNQMSPMIAAGLAVAGIHDNTPDLAGTRQDENFLRRLANYMRGQGWDVPGLSDTMGLSSTTEDLTRGALMWANEFARGMGIPVGEFEGFNRGASELDQLRSWVQYEASQMFGPRFGLNGEMLWTAEQMQMYEEALLNVQTGIDGNPIADAARERYGNEEGLTAGLGLIVPAGAVVNSQFRTDTQSLAQQFRDQGFTGTPEQREANEFRSEATAADPTWTIANQQWHNLGTEAQRESYALYNSLIYNPESLASSGYILQLPGYAYDDPNQWINVRPLLAMDEDMRRRTVEGWFTQTGELTGIQQLQAERDAFKTANPEYADYTTYRSGVYDYEGGATAFRTDLARDNPNFRREMEAYRKYLKDQGRSAQVIEQELDDWASSDRAFLAAIGEQGSVYGKEPIAVHDPTANPNNNEAFANVMGQGSGGNGGQSSGGGGFGQSEERAFKDVWTDYDSPEMQAIDWQTRENRKGWSGSMGEQLYGDAWNEQTGQWEEWADKDYREDVLGLPGGKSDYYVDESPPEPGQAANQNRYMEWVAYMQRTNPGISGQQLSVEAWAAWELGSWEEYLASIGYREPTQVPAVWARYLDGVAA